MLPLTAKYIPPDSFLYTPNEVFLLKILLASLLK